MNKIAPYFPAIHFKDGYYGVFIDPLQSVTRLPCANGILAVDSDFNVINYIEYGTENN